MRLILTISVIVNIFLGLAVYTTRLEGGLVNTATGVANEGEDSSMPNSLSASQTELIAKQEEYIGLQKEYIGLLNQKIKLLEK